PTAARALRGQYSTPRQAAPAAAASTSSTRSPTAGAPNQPPSTTGGSSGSSSTSTDGKPAGFAPRSARAPSDIRDRRVTVPKEPRGHTQPDRGWHVIADGRDATPSARR